MKYHVKWTSSFKKDYKRMLKRGADIELLDHVIRMLAAGETLPPEYHNHTLTGNFADMQECHIKLYQVEPDALKDFQRRISASEIIHPNRETK